MFSKTFNDPSVKHVLKQIQRVQTELPENKHTVYITIYEKFSETHGSTYEIHTKLMSR